MLWTASSSPMHKDKTKDKIPGLFSAKKKSGSAGKIYVQAEEWVSASLWVKS